MIMKILPALAISLAAAATAIGAGPPAHQWEIGPIIRGKSYSVNMPLRPQPTKRGRRRLDGALGLLQRGDGGLLGEAHLHQLATDQPREIRRCQNMTDGLAGKQPEATELGQKAEKGGADHGDWIDGLTAGHCLMLVRKIQAWIRGIRICVMSHKPGDSACQGS